MSDDTLTTAGSLAIENRNLRTKIAELERGLAAARAEAERKDAILRQLAKDGRLWVDAKDIQAARVRLVYQPEHESEIAKARAEAARLRTAIQTVIDSPHYMTNEDITILVEALKEK